VKRVVVVMEVPVGCSRREALQIVRDAFYDYARLRGAFDARGNGVKVYVGKRYPPAKGYGAIFRKVKERQVRRRLGFRDFMMGTLDSRVEGPLEQLARSQSEIETEGEE